MEKKITLYIVALASVVSSIVLPIASVSFFSPQFVKLIAKAKSATDFNIVFIFLNFRIIIQSYKFIFIRNVTFITLFVQQNRGFFGKVS